MYFLCEARQNYPYTGLDGHVDLQEAEAPRISIEFSHEGGKVVSIRTSRLYSRRHPWHFLTHSLP